MQYTPGRSVVLGVMVCAQFCKRAARAIQLGDSFQKGHLKFNDIIEMGSAQSSVRCRKQESCEVTLRLVLYNSQSSHATCIYTQKYRDLHEITRNLLSIITQLYSNSFENIFVL